MRLGELVAELDAYFRVPDVENDDWSGTYEQLYPDPYWRGYAESGYEGRWNGLFVGGGDEIERVVTCVFPADWIISSLAPGTLLFSEHPIAFEDDVEGFAPLSRASFERLKAEGISFYHVHTPLDQHPEVSPSRLVAEGLRLTGLVEYYPIADGLPGGAAIVGESGVTVDELAGLLGEVLGPEIPVEVLSRFRERAGVDADILLASLERGCETFVTGNAATRCRLDFVQAEVRKFHALVDEEGVSVLDGTHYGLEKPPQLAMVPWFERLGLQAEFRPGKPERGPLS